MKKLSLTIEEVQQLHKSGRLDEAKKGYIELLNQHPEDVTVLHLLGILSAEQDDLDAAEDYLRKAIACHANDPVLYLHLANILKAKGLFPQAEQALLELIDLYPRYAAAFNNLGTVCFAQEKWSDAAAYYQTAIDIQSNYVDAYYNLGLALIKLKRNKDAIHVYQFLLELSPHHPGAAFQLGCLFMQQDRYDDAIKHFLFIESHHPFHFETQSNLASCFLRLGQLVQAKTHYLKALDMMPNDTQVLFNLGVISMQQGRVQDAIGYYLRIVKTNPDFYDVHNNLGVAFLAIKNKEKALFHFREALRIKPQHEPARHMIHILTQDKQLSSSPPEYISTLFDSYADHYDSHLTASLNYQVPTLCYQAVKEIFPVMPEQGLDILDLGCGTGLCGELFKPVSHSLIGVDLSEKMLEAASKKAIYDELVKADVVDYLMGKKDVFDLIIAGDVLVYFGDLDSLFSAAFNALRARGLFVFNTEITHHKDYELTESGRFAHRKTYLEQLAHQHQFTLLQSRVTMLRTQHEGTVLGHLFVLQK